MVLIALLKKKLLETLFLKSVQYFFMQNFYIINHFEVYIYIYI